MEAILKRLYTDPNKPSAFSSVKKLFNAAREEIPDLTIAQVREFLKTQRTYTLFKPAVRKFKRLSTVPSGWNTDWQADLMVFISISKKNSGFKYLLVCIDVLSRHLYVEAVKSKKSSDMIVGFEKIFQRSQILPWRLYSDSGLELCSKKMREYFKQKTVDKVEARTNPILHATMVERANRTIRDRLKRYFCENNTLRWVDVIQNLVHAINNSVHSTIKMSPASVNAQNAEIVYQKVYGKPEELKKPKFKIGDTVRFSHKRFLFTKNQTNFTDEIFTIFKVLERRSPPVYILKNQLGEEMTGYFYAQELCPASLDSEFRIEKILRSRVRNNLREYFVKWMGHNAAHNQWISKNDLV